MLDRFKNEPPKWEAKPDGTFSLGYDIHNLSSGEILGTGYFQGTSWEIITALVTANQSASQCIARLRKKINVLETSGQNPKKEK